MSGVSNGQKGNAPTFNNAFASLLGNNVFSGLIHLKKAIGSGAEIIDLQAVINELLNSANNADGSIQSLQDQLNELEGGFFVNPDLVMLGTDGVLVLTDKKLITYRIQGNGGAFNFSLLPFGGAEYVDVLKNGMVIRLIGVHETETMTLRHNDNDYGCILNGDIELNRFRMIELMWLSVDKRFIEVRRNG